MKRHLLAFLLILTLAVPLGSLGLAQSVISIAYLDDPYYESIMYALKEGKIKSDKVSLKFTPLSVPAQIQAMGTKQFDIIGTSSIAFPKAVKRGLRAKIVALGALPGAESYGIFVKKDSPIKQVGDLKGKTLAVHSLGAGNVVQMKIVLQEKYKLNTARVGGNLDLVELPPLEAPALLEREKVDAVFAFAMGFYKAMQNPNFRVIMWTAREYGELMGAPAPVEAYLAYTERIEANPEAYGEVQRLLYETAQYYQKNTEEIDKAIAAKQKADLVYLRWWSDKGARTSLSLESKWLDALDRFYKAAYKIGDLDYIPNIQELVWKGYWEKKS